MTPYVASTVNHSTSWVLPPRRNQIEAAIAGVREPLVPKEMRVVVQVLTARGWSSARIARHVGSSTRTVTRHRAAIYAAQS